MTLRHSATNLQRAGPLDDPIVKRDEVDERIQLTAVAFPELQFFLLKIDPKS